MKLQDAYDRSIDWVLAQWFRFWKWQARVLDVSIELPAPKVFTITNTETVYRDTFATTAALEGLKQVNTHLLRRNGIQAEEIVRLRGQQRPEVLGARATGPDRPNAKKLTQREVTEIRAMKRGGYTQKDIADVYDVNPATISRIVRGHYHYHSLVAA